MLGPRVAGELALTLIRVFRLTDLVRLIQMLAVISGGVPTRLT